MPKQIETGDLVEFANEYDRTTRTPGKWMVTDTHDYIHEVNNSEFRFQKRSICLKDYQGYGEFWMDAQDFRKVTP